MSHMDGRKKSHRSFAEELQGTSPFGRPKRRYGDNIKMDLKEREWKKCLGSIGLIVWTK